MDAADDADPVRASAPPTMAIESAAEADEAGGAAAEADEAGTVAEAANDAADGAADDAADGAAGDAVDSAADDAAANNAGAASDGPAADALHPEAAADSAAEDALAPSMDLPQAAVARLLKASLPAGTVISKDAKASAAKAASIFVLYLASTCVRGGSVGGSRMGLSAHMSRSCAALGFHARAQPHSPRPSCKLLLPTFPPHPPPTRLQRE